MLEIIACSQANFQIGVLIYRVNFPPVGKNSSTTSSARCFVINNYNTLGGYSYFTNVKPYENSHKSIFPFGFLVPSYLREVLESMY